MMDVLNRARGPVGSAAADSGATRTTAPTHDTFTASSDPIQKLEQERARLAGQLEEKYGKSLATLRNQKAQTEKDLARFKQVQAMDTQTWVGNLDCVLGQLERPESLTAEKHADLKNWALALSAKDLPLNENLDTKLLLLRNRIRPAIDQGLTKEVPINLQDKLKSIENLQTLKEEGSERATESALQALRINITKAVESGSSNIADLSAADRQKTESICYETKLLMNLQEQSAELGRQKEKIPRDLLRQLTNVEAQLELYKTEQREREVLLDHAQRERATLGYQKHAEKIKLLSEKTRKLVLEDREKKTPLTEATLKQNQLEFRKALRDLEEWDLQAKTARSGADPYSSSVLLTSTTELVREFQLARHGVNSILDAYKKLLGTAADNFSLSELWKNVDLDELKRRLKEAKDLARDYPLECADLAANLAHTYSILTMAGGITAEIKTILDRRTMENQVIDAILGQQIALYGAGELKEISLEQLALIDLCSRAPYIAGVLMQEQMTGAKAAKAAAAWIPGLGSWTPVQLAAGTAGALAEVRAQKEIASKISRQYEVMANTLRVGLEGYAHGGYAGAIKDAAAYATTRQLIQTSGNIFRAAVENRLTDELLSDWRQAPVTEAAKMVAAVGIGWGAAAAALGSAVVATGGVLTAPIWVSAALTGFTAAAAVKVGSNLVHDQLKSAETKLLEQQRQTANRLQHAYQKLQAERSNLPALPKETFESVAKTDKPEQVLTEIIDAHLVAEEQVFYASLNPSMHIAPKTIEAVVQKLPPVLPGASPR